jgi:hypothetical protein
MREVIIDYTNWRGKRGLRRIIPIGVSFENNEYHLDTQWLLEAIDLNDADHKTKTFALKDIRSWTVPTLTSHDGKSP